MSTVLQRKTQFLLRHLNREIHENELLLYIVVNVINFLYFCLYMDFVDSYTLEIFFVNYCLLVITNTKDSLFIFRTIQITYRRVV